MRGSLTFRPLGVSHGAVVAFFALLSLPFLLLVGAVLISMLSGPQWSGPGALFGALFGALSAFALGWNFYWFLHRISLSTTFDGEQLHWQTGFRSGSMNLGEIEYIRSRFMMIDIYGQNDRITLLPAQGYRTFLEEVWRTRPELASPEKFTIPVRGLGRETLTRDF